MVTELCIFSPLLTADSTAVPGWFQAAHDSGFVLKVCVRLDLVFFLLVSLLPIPLLEFLWLPGSRSCFVAQTTDPPRIALQLR